MKKRTFILNGDMSQRRIEHFEALYDVEEINGYELKEMSEMSNDEEQVFIIKKFN